MNIIYIYNKDWSTQLWQIFDANDIVVNKKISDFWYAEFSINSNSIYNTIEVLREFNEVKIWQNNWDWEFEIFHWYLKLTKAWGMKTEVICRTFEHLLDRKKVETSGSWINTVNLLFQWILDQINSRYDTLFTLSCDVTENVSVSYSKWESMLQILKKVTDKYEFSFRGKVLFVAEAIWRDLTIPGSSYFQFKRDYNEPGDRNVIDFSVTRDADNIANAIQWRSSGFITDATSIGIYWRIEDTLSNSDQDEATQIAQQIQKRKESTKKIELQPNIFDFFFAEVWDIVALYLDAWNELWRTFWSAKIYEKTLRVWGLNSIDISLSQTKAYAQWILDTIRETAKRVERLELQ